MTSSHPVSSCTQTALHNRPVKVDAHWATLRGGYSYQVSDAFLVVDGADTLLNLLVKLTTRLHSRVIVLVIESVEAEVLRNRHQQIGVKIKLKPF